MTNIKKIFVIIFLAAAAFSSAYLICDFAVLVRADSGRHTQNETPVADKSYTVREYRGKIAVFTDGGDTPAYILESPYVRDLPEYDRELLKNGISASSDKELSKILEDYDN